MFLYSRITQVCLFCCCMGIFPECQYCITFCTFQTHTRYSMKATKAAKPQLLCVQPLVLWPTLLSPMINRASIVFFLTRSHMINDINTHDIFPWHLVVTPLSLPLERENCKMLFIEVNHIQNTSQLFDSYKFMALNSWIRG